MRKAGILSVIIVFSIVLTALTFTTVCMAAEESTTEKKAVFPVRVLYAPGHFGNCYEVMGQNQMRDYLAEAVHWGFNGYADWFDVIDCADPFTDPLYNMAGAMWDRKKVNFRTAQSLGMRCYLAVSSNHVYLNQVRKEIEADKSENRIFGQLICPSIPEARKIILRNHENLFADLAKSGVRLTGLFAYPYDYGGCACKKCRPWILTFAKLCREIHAIAEKYHPGIEMNFVGWWWTDQEHQLFKEWVDSQAPGWVKSLALHMPYNKTDVADVPLPKGCPRHAFVHIGYSEDAKWEKGKPRDLYGHFGPVIAPGRLERTVTDLKAHGCTGIMAYSEGLSDDVNKSILAGLASGKYNSADEVLCAYAKKYFGADKASARQWAKWLRDWGWPFKVDIKQAAKTLSRLGKNAPFQQWRLQQWEFKPELLRLNALIMSETKWSPRRLATAEQFLAVQERLQREVWGLGLLRHILARAWDWTPVPWYKDWAKYTLGKTDRAKAPEATGEE